MNIHSPPFYRKTGRLSTTILEGTTPQVLDENAFQGRLAKTIELVR